MRHKIKTVPDQQLHIIPNEGNNIFWVRCLPDSVFFQEVWSHRKTWVHEKENLVTGKIMTSMIEDPKQL
jgi:hypothetical protein